MMAGAFFRPAFCVPDGLPDGKFNRSLGQASLVHARSMERRRLVDRNTVRPLGVPDRRYGAHAWR